VRELLDAGVGETVDGDEEPIEDGDTISIQLWDKEAQHLRPSITLEEIVERDIHPELRLEKTNPEAMDEEIEKLTGSGE
jgi:hypothetical protein